MWQTHILPQAWRKTVEILTITSTHFAIFFDFSLIKWTFQSTANSHQRGAFKGCFFVCLWLPCLPVFCHDVKEDMKDAFSIKSTSRCPHLIKVSPVLLGNSANSLCNFFKKWKWTYNVFLGADRKSRSWLVDEETLQNETTFRGFPSPALWQAVLTFYWSLVPTSFLEKLPAYWPKGKTLKI